MQDTDVKSAELLLSNHEKLMKYFVTTLGNITRAKGAKDAKLGEMGKCFSLRS